MLNYMEGRAEIFAVLDEMDERDAWRLLLKMADRTNEMRPDVEYALARAS